jgi:hypothetical protein
LFFLSFFYQIKSKKPDAALEKFLSDHRSARGPSLIEQHQQAIKSGAKKAKTGSSSSFKFDREEAGSKVSAHDLGGMIADAKALDSRFSRSVTKNFM